MLECEICRCPFPGYLVKRVEGQPSSLVCVQCLHDGTVWAARNAYLLKRSEAVNEAASRDTNSGPGNQPEGGPPAPG